MERKGSVVRTIPVRFDFYLDNNGIIYNANNPIMLDAMDYMLCGVFYGRFKGVPKPHMHEEPIEQTLHFAKTKINGTFVFNASALFPADDNNTEDIQLYRKRFDYERLFISSGSPNTSSVYRDSITSHVKVLTNHLIAYALVNCLPRRGKPSTLSRLKRSYNRFFKHLGKKEYGKIIKIDITKIDKDYSLVKDGLAMRFLPCENGSRFNRVKPPYWNICDRVQCCEIGEETDINLLSQGHSSFPPVS